MKSDDDAASAHSAAASAGYAEQPPPPLPWGNPFTVFQDMGPNEPTVFDQLGPPYGIKNIGPDPSLEANGSPYGIQANGMGVDWPSIQKWNSFSPQWVLNGASPGFMGGVPQASNLSRALESMAVWIEKSVPTNLDGIACIDFEEWTNVWELHVSAGRLHDAYACLSK
jgi:hypothetical protein